MSTSEHSKGNRIAIRRAKSAASKTGDAYAAEPVRPSPDEKMWRETVTEIQTTVPDFNKSIEPHMQILVDFWNTRIRISRGADFKDEMQQFLEKHPIMNSENEISTNLSPATILIRDRFARKARIRR